MIKYGKVACFLAMFALWKVIFFFGKISVKIEMLIWIYEHRKEKISYEQYSEIVLSRPTNAVLNRWYERLFRVAEWAGITIIR